MGKTSPLFTLNWQDAIKGLITAVIGGVVSVVSNDVASGLFTLNGTALWHGALVGGVAYLTKNFFTPSQPLQTVTQTPNGTVTQTAITTDQVNVVVPGK